MSAIFRSGGAGKRRRSEHVADEAAVVVHGVEALDGLDLRVDALQVIQRLRRRSTPGRIVANFSVMRRPAVRGG